MSAVIARVSAVAPKGAVLVTTEGLLHHASERMDLRTSYFVVHRGPPSVVSFCGKVILVTSVVGWLDQSEEHQRKMREVIDLFSESDARDELGIGVVRDALSDLLFPGLSTIQTRARYFLFIPWIYLDLERRRTPSAKMAEQARRRQTSLICALEAGNKEADKDNVGVIGIDAKEKLKRLPDSVYWTGLGTFGVRRYPGQMSDYYRSIERFYRQATDAAGHEAEEMIGGHRPHNWDLDLPEPPEGLLKTTTLSLRPEESEYLRQQMITAGPDTLLAHLLLRADVTANDVVHPWDALDPTSASDVLIERVEYARWFSDLILGAALLYNLLMAEAATKRNLQSGGPDRVETYRAGLDDWATLIATRAAAIGTADRSRFWQLISTGGGRVPESTRVFLDRWFDMALDAPNQIGDSIEARELIVEREYRLKRGLARLQNPRQLELWGGSSGVGRLTYRWGTGRTMVDDIVNGLKSA